MTHSHVSHTQHPHRCISREFSNDISTGEKRGKQSGKETGWKRKKVLSTAYLGLICGDIEFIHGDIGLMCGDKGSFVDICLALSRAHLLID